MASRPIFVSQKRTLEKVMFDDPRLKLWRERAAEARTLAGGMRAYSAADAMREAAAHWDIMADTLERSLEKDTATKKPISESSS